MKTGIPPLIIGNWKMNPQSTSLASKLGVELKKKVGGIKGVDIVIAPPAVYLDTLSRARGSRPLFMLGAQNVHHEKLGAYTGEVSLPMLMNLGVTHIILGHSERRRDGETDEMVQKKLGAAVKAGAIGVVCVGESERDSGGHYLSLVESQIRRALAGLSKAKLGQVVIAYEPVWAIGKTASEAATPRDVGEMMLYVKKVLAPLGAEKAVVLYGGSVEGANAKALMKEGGVGGFLVGHASADAKQFAALVTAVS